MVKKIITALLKILIVIIVYLLQIFVVSNTSFFGITGDLCLMAIVVITLMEENHIAYAAGVLCGITSDILFSTTIGKYLLIYILVVSVLIGLKKMYKQDSKLAIIIFSVCSVITSEILLLLFNIIDSGSFVNLFTYIFNIVKQSIINICLALVIYLMFKIVLFKGE